MSERFDRGYQAALTVTLALSIAFAAVIVAQPPKLSGQVGAIPYPHTGQCHGATGDIREACVAAWQLIYAANALDYPMYCRRRVPSRLVAQCSKGMSDLYAAWYFSINGGLRVLDAYVLMDGVARVRVTFIDVDNQRAYRYIDFEREHGLLRYYDDAPAPGPPAS